MAFHSGVLATVFLAAALPGCAVHAQAAPPSTPAISPGSLSPDEAAAREARCLKAGRWIGTISGSTMGVLLISWRAAGVSGTHGPMWKNVATAVPSALLGSYVGTRTTEWMTRRIMEGRPKAGKAALKGAAYGALDGAITLTASLVPLLTIGHYTGTIEFNLSEELILLKLLGAAAAGGALYGGFYGAVIGAAYGPCVSVHMRF